jgi:hypothetical protein
MAGHDGRLRAYQYSFSGACRVCRASSVTRSYCRPILHQIRVAALATYTDLQVEWPLRTAVPSIGPPRRVFERRPLSSCTLPRRGNIKGPRTSIIFRDPQPNVCRAHGRPKGVRNFPSTRAVSVLVSDRDPSHDCRLVPMLTFATSNRTSTLVDVGRWPFPIRYCLQTVTSQVCDKSARNCLFAQYWTVFARGRRTGHEREQ